MRNSVTPGWLGFWETRAMPQGDYRPRQHGNTRHGRYAKGRWTWRQILCSPPAPLPLGWRVYSSVRRYDAGQGQDPGRASAGARPVIAGKC